MLLFEISFVGAYCNRLSDLGERRGFFSCYGRIKVNSASKNLNITNINTKAGPPNRQIGLPLNSSFFNCQNNHRLGNAINFDYTLPALLTHLKITNGSL